MCIRLVAIHLSFKVSLLYEVSFPEVSTHVSVSLNHQELGRHRTPRKNVRPCFAEVTEQLCPSQCSGAPAPSNPSDNPELSASAPMFAGGKDRGVGPGLSKLRPS